MDTYATTRQAAEIKKLDIYWLTEVLGAFRGSVQPSLTLDRYSWFHLSLVIMQTLDHKEKG